MDEKKISFTQYSLFEIILIWLAVTIPIGISGWIASPILSEFIGNSGAGRMLAITIGLIWQFVLVLLLLWRENKKLCWRVFKTKLLLQNPINPKTNKEQKSLWLLIIPLIMLTAFYQMFIAKHIINFWTTIFPIFKDTSSLGLSNYLNSSQGSREVSKNVRILCLYIVCAIFNTFLGEELLFRGILLPRMNKVFGKTDWIINGILFGLYHIHQPWGILSTIILTVFIFSLSAKIFKCTWFSIITHSGQSIYFIILMTIMLIKPV